MRAIGISCFLIWAMIAYSGEVGFIGTTLFIVSLPLMAFGK